MAWYTWRGRDRQVAKAIAGVESESVTTFSNLAFDRARDYDVEMLASLSCLEKCPATFDFLQL